MEENINEKEFQTVGEMLKNARLDQRKQLSEIAGVLYIRQSYLAAIEDMDLLHIPPMPYSLGFVRSYAQYLGLNSDRIVAAYRQVLSGEDDGECADGEKAVRASAPRLKHVIIGLCGLIFLFMIWSVLPLSQSVEPYRISAVEKEQQVEQKGEETIIPAVDEGQISESPAIEEKGADSLSQDVKEDSENASQEAEAAEPKLRLVLSGPSWLELRQGNKVYLNNLYNKGYSYDIPNEKGLAITVGRPQNVSFYLNDKPITVATKENRKNIQLDKYFTKEN